MIVTGTRICYEGDGCIDYPVGFMVKTAGGVEAAAETVVQGDSILDLTGSLLLVTMVVSVSLDTETNEETLTTLSGGE